MMEQVRPKVRVKVFTRSQRSMNAFTQDPPVLLFKWAQDNSLLYEQKLNKSESGQVNHFYKYRGL